jgi:hypothetical protein
MGKVYRAHDPILDRPVALKTVTPSLLKDKDALARFRREARAAARLQHPNIVTIYEVGEVEGTHYIAMELIEGLDLGEAMVPPDRFPLPHKVRVIVDVCRGLHFAHRMGVVHRDVKPANIRLTQDGTVKILDFGIARVRGTETTDPNLTQAGMVLGTPSYLSPELLQGAKVDHRADMWAVGVILYEILAGRRPFEAPTITGLITKIVQAPPPALDGSLRLPDGLAAATLRALDKEPDRRFADLEEMSRALLRSIGAAPEPELPLDPLVKKRAYESNFAEARRMLAEQDLSGALEAARRAQSLDPSRTGIIALIKVIEQRLRSAETLRPAAPAPGGEATRRRTRAPAHGHAGPRDPARPARHRHAAGAGRGRLPRDGHLRRAARHQGSGAVSGGRHLRRRRRRRRDPALGAALAQQGHVAADRPAPAHGPRCGSARARLLPRRGPARLGPRRRGGAPVGHGDGRRGARAAAP